MFNLFLRRAGVRGVPAVLPKTTSRLTVECPRDALADVRRQIYQGFNTGGLRVATLQVDHARNQAMARTCVTVDCPPELRPQLMDQARLLGSHPGVHRVQWGDHRLSALN
jgi:hypothetical protein